MESVIPSGQVEVLVFAAHGPDLRGLRSAITDRFDGIVNSVHVTAKTVGVGVVAAGPAASKRLFQLQPRVVVHIGTCAVYPSPEGAPEFKPNDIVVASEVHLVSPAALAGKAAFPPPMQTRLDPSLVLRSGVAEVGRVHQVPVASTLCHTRDEGFAREIALSSGARVENLEVFAIAQACAYSETPFVSIMAATHRTWGGTEDHARFERDGTLVAAQTCLNWINRGAKGMTRLGAARR